ncbi:hypothetical protein JQC92_04480 [Shewanella sp. 202IG2-18]|nr:hypothetical protein [Parashewanella hymeniacidonis]MBM7071298.1 hypothetical protein [Parashewanella hymeniacidonis]
MATATSNPIANERTVYSTMNTYIPIYLKMLDFSENAQLVNQGDGVRQ